MHRRMLIGLAVCLLACGGCSKTKSTAELIEDLKGSDERDRLIAVRLLPLRKAESAKVVPALIDALKDKENDIRLSAAIGLGTLGEEARDAIPALQQTAESGHDSRVRKAAATALSRIDPARFSDPAQKH
jgi:HEAT repeat protein